MSEIFGEKPWPGMSPWIEGGVDGIAYYDKLMEVGYSDEQAAKLVLIGLGMGENQAPQYVAELCHYKLSAKSSKDIFATDEDDSWWLAEADGGKSEADILELQNRRYEALTDLSLMACYENVSLDEMPQFVRAKLAPTRENPGDNRLESTFE